MYQLVSGVPLKIPLEKIYKWDNCWHTEYRALKCILKG